MLFFRFVPDKAKKKIGIAYLYTAEYEQSDEYLNSKHSVLKRQITVMTMSEAVLLGVFVIIISNVQIAALTDNQRYIVRDRDSYSDTDTSDGTDETDDSSGETTAGTIAGQIAALSEEQLENLSEHLAPNDHYLFIMNLQLALYVVSIAIPLGMFFNDLMVRKVVLPIKTLSTEMNSYFSADDEERQKIDRKSVV